MTEGNKRAILSAFLANLGIAVAKFAAWMATGAASMLAEAVHSVADTANQALLLLGGARAARAPTPEHPFGYGRERYFWAFVVGIVLFLIGGLFAISEGVSKLRDPHEVVSPGWAIGVLVVAIVFESFSIRVAILESNKVRARASWWEFIRHSKSPELPVVLLEDAGALLGLVLALIGVTLSSLLGDPIYDALGSIAIGGLLCAIAVVVSIEMKSLLIGESASRENIRKIAEAIATTPGVHRLIHLRTLHVGPEELFVGAKVELDPILDLTAASQVIDRAEERVRATVAAVEYIYLEPDVHDPTRSGAEPRGVSAGSAE